MSAQLRVAYSNIGVKLICFPLVLAMLLVGGCGKRVQRVPVSGKVLIDGEAVTLGMIRFIPDSGRPASGKISEDGSFRVVSSVPSSPESTVEGLVPGVYRVSVLAKETLGESENAEVRWHIPRRYGDYRSSELEYDIQAPNNSMLVELTWEGSQEETDAQETNEAQESNAEEAD